MLVKDEDGRSSEDDHRFDNQDRRSEQFVYVDDFVSNCIIWKLAKLKDEHVGD